MTTSIYKNKEFATFWNDRAGEQGELYKRCVLDPVMQQLAGSLAHKTVLELGCGNGYLGPRFLQQNPDHVMLADLSPHNIAFAKQKTNDPRVSFLTFDATQTWPVESDAVDVIFSTMMLNEIEDIRTPLTEAARTLTSGGRCIIAVTHPAWDLWIYAQQQAGKPSSKIVNLGGYFRRGFASFMMGGDSKTNPALQQKYGGKVFAVEHYQRPLADYFTALKAAGLTITDLIEPEIPQAMLAEAPRYVEQTEFPMGLIIAAAKPTTSPDPEATP